MAQLGYAATGAGQGILQQRQYNDQQARQQQLYGLQERQVGLQERGLEDEKTRWDKEFSRREVDRLRNLLIDPNWNKTATSAMKEKVKSSLNRIFAKYPEYDYGETGSDTQQPGQGQAPPTTAPTTAPPAPTEQPQAPPMPELYGLGQKQPQALPTDPQFGAGAIDAGTPQFEPMSPTPVAGGPGITGANNGPWVGPPRPGAPRPAAPAPVAATPQGPTQTQVTPPPKRITPREFWAARSVDPRLSEADQMEAIQNLQKLDESEANIRASNAQAGYSEELTKQLPKNAESERALRAEQIAMSVYQRTEQMPQELQIALAKARAKQSLDPADLIAIENLKLQVLKFSKELGDTAWQRGQQLDEFLQRERLAQGAQEATSRGRVESTILKGIMQDNTVIDPVTRMPRFKPGGLQRVIQQSQQLIAQGQQVTPDDTNPGFDPQLWTMVTDPNFNLNAGLQAVRNDPVRSKQLKQAASMAQQMRGATTPRAAAAPTAAGPAPRPVNKARINQIVNDGSLTASEKVDALEGEGLPVPSSLRKSTGGVPVKRGQLKTDKDWVAPKMGPIEKRRAEARRISQRR